MTSEPLTGDHGKALLTWYLAGSRAQISALPGKAPESKEKIADYGWKWPGSLTKYDHNLRLWKTRQCSLFEEFTEFSGTWPRWGSMLDGELLPQQTLMPRTLENESGLWPTLNTLGYRSDGELQLLAQRADSYNEFIALSARAANSKRLRAWSTLRASDRSKGGPNSRDGSGSLHLSSAAFLADLNGEPPFRASESRQKRHPWPDEPNVGRVANGVPFRVDRLKALGNAQVPRVVATAWRILSSRIA